jgi:phenylacetate-coenzyme A ligase PaaK-like adenylate-forming protein
MEVIRPIKTILKPFYYRLPARICYGRQFTPFLELLAQSENWSEDRLLAFQLDKLRAMLRHCAANVPYYRKLFRRVGFDPNAFRGISDLTALPTLDKETIRVNSHELLAENIRPRDRLYFTTGGTTGEPLGVYNLRQAGGREKAFMFAQWARVGFHHDERRAMLRGWPVKSQRHWRYEPSERAYLFSNFHMTPENAAEYARVMHAKRLRYLHSYPSAVIDFARQLKRMGAEPPRLKAILASSENLYPGQREFIESFFEARMFSWYGHSEDTILAGECEVSNYYHIFPEYGVAEILGGDGKAAEHDGESGELVGTSLDNLAMPLIRYRTGDWATVGPDRCACGRNYKLLKEARGRWTQEMLLGKLDNLISVTALNVHTDVFDNVKGAQFYQCEKGRVELRIVRGTDYSDRDSRRILSALGEKMGDTMDIGLVFRDEIPLSPRGKFRMVVQELTLPQVAFDEVRIETPA